MQYSLRRRWKNSWAITDGPRECVTRGASSCRNVTFFSEGRGYSDVTVCDRGGGRHWVVVEWMSTVPARVLPPGCTKSQPLQGQWTNCYISVCSLIYDHQQDHSNRYEKFAGHGLKAYERLRSLTHHCGLSIDQHVLASTIQVCAALTTAVVRADRAMNRGRACNAALIVSMAAVCLSVCLSLCLHCRVSLSIYRPVSVVISTRRDVTPTWHHWEGRLTVIDRGRDRVTFVMSVKDDVTHWATGCMSTMWRCGVLSVWLATNQYHVAKWI